MTLQYHLLDVFSDTPFGGNQLAVFPEARGVDAGLMQQIARELNLSEVVFVLPPTQPGAVHRLRIFTPRIELPFAGHPTIGAAHLLVTLGVIPMTGAEARFQLEEAIGLVAVTARRAGDGTLSIELTAAQAPTRGADVPSLADLAALVRLPESDIGGDGVEPQAVSAGVPFLFVPIRTRQALGRAHLDLDQWRRLLEHAWAPHVVLFCGDPEHPEADFRVRMFAPAMGIPEDPATGAAAAAFAAYLAWRQPAMTGTLRWTLEQGIEMGRPSLLRIEADRSGAAITALRVGGTAVIIGAGALTPRADAREGAGRTAAQRAESLALEFLERVWGPAQDLDAIDAVMTEDYRIVSGGIEIAGRAAFKDWVRSFQGVLSHARTENVEVFANAAGDRVVSRWLCSGTNNGIFGVPADQRTVSFTGIAIWTVRDGRLAHCWVERAALEAYRALTTSAP